MKVDILIGNEQLQATNLASLFVCWLQFSAVLEQSGIHNVVYHKNISREDRDAALATMADASAGNVVMVSTDAASRGIDLPDITHVIQVGETRCSHI